VDFAAIRRLVVVAVFADDELMRRVVLKGGNALALVHHIGGRTSLDVDFSLEDDFADLVAAERRLVHSLTDRFDSAGYLVFDAHLIPRPANPDGRPPTWGGYRLEFKLIPLTHFEQLGGDLTAMRRQAEIVAPGQQRTFTIEISKHEYCAGKVEAELDGYTIYVYTPAMIAIEKLRAICQQMPEYTLVRNKRARARDFYDIVSILSEAHIDLATPENLDLARHIFAAKDVPLRLIARIPDTREFHRPDWPSVKDTIAGELQEYDVYFDAVAAATRALHPLWEE
jgi:hypothetical protein